MPLSTYLLYCHATVSVRLLVRCRRLEQIIPKNRRLNALNNRRKRACIILRSLGGEPVELWYEPEMYGIQQIDSVDEETLLLFTSKTDKACLRDLFDSHCFTGDAEKQVHDIEEGLKLISYLFILMDFLQ